ncbi:unnamed protein product [Brachionus calyciflorus]|uniref:Acetyl-coenzyme A transporter 1 n=1 Tax=Brachionus calyciflorus TaxID=104777 RepID=A0A814KWN3_9BILA|nr:unnamed protein product [Brachionus calyciflorus]
MSFHDLSLNKKQHNLQISIEKKNIEIKSKNNDFKNIVFLMFLYFLQGIPIGLTASLPYILSSRNVSYFYQATFSLASWPFAMKLLWAPIVDSVFIERIGRRKSWLVPIQYLIGIFMIIFADYVHEMIENNKIFSSYDIYILTSIFFMFTFLAATQDIAVDGWGLTILSKEKASWASICNNAGSTSGVLIGNSLFLILESEDFCNRYIRPIFGLPAQEYGLVDLREFMHFFGVVFIVSTTLILFFKQEKNNYKDESLESNLSISETFGLLTKIVKLEPVQQLLLILFTCKIAFATSSIRTLKMIEVGVPKETLGLINGYFQFIQILTPIFAGKLYDLSKPLEAFYKIYSIRILITIFLVLWVYVTPEFRTANNEYPYYYFLLYIALNSLYFLIFSAMALFKTAFFTHISDKNIGGTYMTLLNTIANIGVHWPTTLSLYLIDVLSIKHCVFEKMPNISSYSAVRKRFFNDFVKNIHENTCSTEFEQKNCHGYGAKCAFRIDAFYLLSIICSLIGVFWLFKFKKIISYLQSLSKQEWRITELKKNQIIIK